MKQDVMKQIAHLTALVFLLLGTVFTSVAQDFDYLENAVYTYNFVRHTTWPGKKEVVDIGIIGATPLEAALKSLLAHKANSYVVRNIQPAEARNMDVVIVARSAADELKAICDHTATAPVLIISEKPNMGRAGACISFFMDEDNDLKTSYQLNIKNCKKRGLSVSEQIINNAAQLK